MLVVKTPFSGSKFAVFYTYLTFNRMLVLLGTDSKLYGRVMGVYLMTWSLMPMATLPMVALVDAVGAPLTVAVAGALLGAFITIMALMFPGIWHRDEKSSLFAKRQV